MLVPMIGSCTEKADTVLASIVWFTEQEPDLDPYRTRMIVTQRYLRIDEGDDGGDFLLFDRKKKTIYSTNTQDRRVLVIHPRPLAKPSPLALEHQELKDDTHYPPVGGRPVVHYRYFTNRELCLDVFSAEGLLPPVTQALREYHNVLAGEQAVLLAAPEFMTPSGCDLANNIYVPSRHLQRGFPIRQQDMTGRTRELQDFTRAIAVKSELFHLPRSYTFFTVEDLRRGEAS